MKKNRFVYPLSKTFLLLATLFMTVSATHGQDPQKNRMTSYGMGFVEYLPAGYSSSTAKYPAIIFLHGSGERGTGSANDLQKVRNQGPPKLIKNGEKMCFTVNGKTECFIVLSPQTNKWNWKYDVIPFIKYALANYRIDPARVYVTGLSMGGEGAWLTAGLEDNSPNLIAAVGVMCGRASQAVGFTVASRKIPVWAFHGDKDTAIGIGSGLIPITAMLSANASPAPIWTKYAGVSHG
ncbi:MAG TPA: PHB depolymerase family esterase, partial [Ohtaekwangia sp.]|nr:PHB depolymerase family esterase [Ohtaekwangia sp.]